MLHYKVYQISQLVKGTNRSHTHTKKRKGHRDPRMV